MWQPIKAVDLIAVSPAETAYLIEVKDYRLLSKNPPSELPRLAAQKVFDTLAALIPCKLNANADSERRMAERVCGATKLVVVLHLEQPKKAFGIFRPYNRADLQQKLRQLLKPVDAHPQVLHMGALSSIGWTVS